MCSSSCFNMFGIASRDNVLPFSFLAFGSSLGAVCRSRKHNACEWVYVFFCFYHTDWLTFAVVSLSYSVVWLSPWYIFLLLVSSTVRNVFRVSFFMFVRIIQNIETRITTNMFVEFWAKGTCIHTLKLSAYFRLRPFLNILFLVCDALAHTKSFLWYTENGDTREVAKTIMHTETKYREENRQKHGEMS